MSVRSTGEDVAEAVRFTRERSEVPPPDWMCVLAIMTGVGLAAGGSPMQ